MPRVALKTTHRAATTVDTSDISSIYVERGFASRVSYPSDRFINFSYNRSEGAGISVHVKDGTTFGAGVSIGQLLQDIAESGHDLSAIEIVTPEFFLTQKGKPILGLGVRDGRHYMRYLGL